MQTYQYTTPTKSAFRAYDIRGLVGSELDEHAYYTIGKAVATQLYLRQRKTCYVGRDGRLSSESLAKALQQGLVDSGIDVIDIGLVATPMLYFATQGETDSGLMVTGSHNPATYNGIKLVLAGQTLSHNTIQALYETLVARDFRDLKGKISTHDVTTHYIQAVVRNISLKRPLKVVVDGGNGMAGPFIPEILKQLGCEVIPLYCDIDGRFPNHHPDPTVESNLHDLKEAVAKEEACLGLAFDGDADRIGVVTQEGTMICPDRLMILYALDILKRQPRATVVYDVKCSNHLARAITAAGGHAHMSPTGHSLVKQIMKEKNAALAGEMSGHIFFKERWFGFDDAMYSACRLLEIISQSSQSVSEQFATIPNSLATPEIKIEIEDSEKFAFMDAFQKLCSFKDATIITIDGIRAEFANGWGLVRASNTTPCLVARFEADNETALLAIKAQFKQALLSVNSSRDVPF